MQSPINCIAPDLLKQQMKGDQPILLIDVRSEHEYNEQHIPAAINIPLPQLAAAAVHFSKEHFYVTVCGKGGGRSAEAAEHLKKAGLVSAWLCNGTSGWFA